MACCVCAGHPVLRMLPLKRMQRIISAVARRDVALLGRVTCHDSNESAFVRQITRRALDWGKLEREEIVVANSCTEAISLCLPAVAKPGDTIAIESPTYFMLLQMIESQGMKALEIPTHPKTGPSLDALEVALRAGLVQACLFIPNANNPLGCIMPEANQKRLAGLLTEYNIPLIEDDVYGDLCFTPERPWPVKAYDSSGHVLLCSSFSKAITPAARSTMASPSCRASCFRRRPSMAITCASIAAIHGVRRSTTPSRCSAGWCTKRATPPDNCLTPHFCALSRGLRRWSHPARLRRFGWLKLHHRSSQTHQINHTDREHQMNILNNMEAVFVAAIIVATSASFATATVPTVPAARILVAASAFDSSHVSAHIATVTIAARRLTPAEKAALI